MEDTSADLLDCLLSAAADLPIENIKQSQSDRVKLKEVNKDNEDGIFLETISNTDANPPTKKTSGKTALKSNTESQHVNKTKSLIHTGDTDSSDDESNRYFENSKYDDFGKSIKQTLANSSSSQSAYRSTSTWKTKTTSNQQLSLPANKPPVKADVYTDPVFGIRIVNPLISSLVLQERMVGREAVPMAKVKRYVEKLSNEKDWVIAGAIVHKSVPKTSQKGSTFCIWTLSDLHNDLKTVSLFLFSGAYNQLWKTTVGTVVGILNPTVFDRKDSSKDEACLSVDNAQKVMVFGQSKDLGICKSTKKNGEKCTSIVNTNRCEFCIYHIKQEYQKCSRRSELQSNFSGRGLTALRNKVLGKNEVFYAGKSYMAIPASKSKKLVAKDDKTLKSLSGLSVNSNKATKINNLQKKKAAVRLEQTVNQRAKDMELLRKLGGSNELNFSLNGKSEFSANLSSEVTVQDSKSTALSVIAKLKSTKSTNSANLSTAQYDQKADLIVGLEGKNQFGTKLSSEVTTDESRQTALSVIKKLKAKNLDNIANIKNNNISGEQFENEEVFSNPSKDTFTDFFAGLTKECTSEEKAAKCVSASDVSECNKGKQKPKENLQVQNHIVDNSKNLFPSLSVPSLSGSKTVDLSKPITRRHVDRAKVNALKWVQKNGPIKKANPMNTRGTGKKRPLEPSEEAENDPKKQKIQENEFFSERFKKMMAATSKHANLLEQRDDEEQEKYFNKLEMKERMEEKMLSTYKLECKAVRCLKCKYTNFSASDMCKAEKHPLKVFDAFKRFFKCGDCGNRTVTLDVIPTVACKNCGSGKWERTTMMKERKAGSLHTLSIRGGEQTFTNSVISNGNLDLMVPDD